jgi:hypothetical protein
MSYEIRCTVARSHGWKKIEWEFDGNASGTLARRTWKTMVASGRTIDSDEPYRSAALLRDGAVVESIGEPIAT